MNGPTASVEAERRGDHIIVRVAGELDVFNAADITVTIEGAIPTEAHGAAVDLTEVGFLDSTAIRKLFGLATRLTERRQRLVIATPEDSTVRRTLQLVEFSRAAPMHATLDDALDALGIGDPDASTGAGQK
jgi:anti-anti-sigma factor